MDKIHSKITKSEARRIGNIQIGWTGNTGTGFLCGFDLGASMQLVRDQKNR